MSVYISQTMDGLPDLTVSSILSFLRNREVCKCACISKQWASHVEEKWKDAKGRAARARAQVNWLSKFLSLRQLDSCRRKNVYCEVCWLIVCTSVFCSV